MSAAEIGEREIYRRCLKWHPDEQNTAIISAEVYRAKAPNGTVKHGIVYNPGYTFLDMIDARSSRQWQQWFDGTGPSVMDAAKWIIALKGDCDYDCLPFGPDPKEAGLVTLQAMAFTAVVYNLIMLTTARGLPEFRDRLAHDLSNPALIPIYQRLGPSITRMRYIILENKLGDMLIPLHYSSGMLYPPT